MTLKLLAMNYNLRYLGTQDQKEADHMRYYITTYELHCSTGRLSMWTSVEQASSSTMTMYPVRG